MRVKIITIAVYVAFAILLIGLISVQILRGPFFKDLSENNRIRLVPIKGPRGMIYDRNGNALVENRPSYNITAIPQELKNKTESFKKLSKIINKDPQKLQLIYKKNYTAPFVPIVLAGDVDRKTAIIVEESRIDIPGVMVQVQPVRFYLNNNLASHLLGFLGEIDRQELLRLRQYGYKIKDLIGRAGVEKSYDSYLRGEDGGMQVEIDNKGTLTKILGFKKPQKGKDIQLTIDIRIQKIVDNLLGNQKGAVIVMDPQTGEILAIESSPGFDPNIFIQREKRKKVKEILKDNRKPLLNRAISGLYPPGSIFKIIVAAAALETGKIFEHSRFSCSGKYFLGNKQFGCWDPDGHGSQRIPWALANSCNVFFYQAGRVLGPDNIHNYASLFGAGKPCNIDLPGENKGLLPSRSWIKAVRHKKWYEGDTLNFSIGQGYLLVTPLQMVKMVSCIANGGYVVTPFVVKKIGDKEVADAKSRKIKIGTKTIDLIKDGMQKVVEAPNATGNRAYVQGAAIAAKTGTAQAGRGSSHAWIVGFYPADKPKISFVILIEHGGSGGMGPALIVRDLVEEIRKRKIL